MLGPHRLGSAGNSAIPPKVDSKKLTPQAEKQAVRRFVSRVGGLQNARSALALLALLDGAGGSKSAGG